MSFGYFGLLSYGMQFVNSGQTSVLVYTMPIFATVLAHFILNEKLTVIKVLGLCLGVTGLLIILGPQVFQTEVEKVFMGRILILLSAFSWACANIFSKVQSSGYDIIKMSGWQMFIGSMFLICVSAITEPWTNIQWTFASSSSLLFNGIFSTAIAFVVWFWVLGKIEASIASLTIMIVPILALFFGWLQLDEKLTFNIVIGTIFICLGIFFGAYKVKRFRKE
ncbi:MAG: hypothetical protein K0Q73_3616 [Paenibacillus sp.]|jgi:drug/metabolite transporter (DMT)-like permease|nr:hypothetical protein [Paenibacillus sp.]